MDEDQKELLKQALERTPSAFPESPLEAATKALLAAKNLLQGTLGTVYAHEGTLSALHCMVIALIATHPKPEKLAAALDAAVEIAPKLETQRAEQQQTAELTVYRHAIQTMVQMARQAAVPGTAQS